MRGQPERRVGRGHRESAAIEVRGDHLREHRGAGGVERRHRLVQDPERAREQRAAARDRCADAVPARARAPAARGASRARPCRARARSRRARRVSPASASSAVRFSSAVSSSFSAGACPANAIDARTTGSNGATGLPVPADLARVGQRQSGQHPQQRRLAGAVRAGHDQRVAGLDRERESLEQPRVAATRGEIVGFEHGRAMVAGSAVDRTESRTPPDEAATGCETRRDYSGRPSGDLAWGQRLRR